MLYSGSSQSSDGPEDASELETMIEVAPTSPSRHSLVLNGCPPHSDLWNPVERRDVRVVEGARWESEMGEQRQANSETPYRVVPQRLSTPTRSLHVRR